MNQDIKFTIIIPTRDRADVLKYSLASATAQDYENLEIIVSDNASTDNTHEIVSQANDKRIRYINTGERLSMSHNWEFALNHVSEGWITILGDDDAILPGALEKVNQIVNETNVQFVRASAYNYMWPSFLESKFGELSVEMKRGYKKVNSKKALSKVINGNLLYPYLPMLYTSGFVDFNLIEQAKKISKSFYLSMTPDVYSAIIFSLLTNEYVYSFEPLAINGRSYHSGGASAFYKKDFKKEINTSKEINTVYNPANIFFSEKNIPFHQDLPLSNDGKPLVSLQAIIYEAYLQAAPFVQEIDPNATRERQLEIILTESLVSVSGSLYRKEIFEWGQKFAALHGLNFNQILQKVYRFLPVSKARKYVDTLSRWLSIYYVYGCPNLPIKNVFEASIVGNVVKSLRPNNIGNLIKRLAIKYLQSKKI